MMEDVVKPRLDWVASGCPYIFQQDGTPAHNSKWTQEWLKANLPEVWEKEIWSPSLPECNPFNYFVWGFPELQVNDSLINKIKMARAASTGTLW
jgi:hypothetical protein